MKRNEEDIDAILSEGDDKKKKPGRVKVLNHTHFPRTIDVGPINAEAPGERLVMKVPKGEFDNEARRIVPGSTIVTTDLWQKVQAHNVGSKLIEKGIITGAVQ